MGERRGALLLLVLLSGCSPSPPPPASPAPTNTAGRATTVPSTTRPSPATTPTPSASRSTAVLAQRPGRTAIRYSCRWVKDSRMDFATRYGGSAVEQAPSGPTYSALVQDMPSILGVQGGQRQWEAKVDVPSRYLEVTVWPLTAETTEAVIAAGRVDVALSCLPGAVAPDPSVVSVQR